MSGSRGLTLAVLSGGELLRDLPGLRLLVLPLDLGPARVRARGIEQGKVTVQKL